MIEPVRTAGNAESDLTLRLTFVISAYTTAQRMIKFSDEKASFIFLFFGIILSVFGIRGDRILMILGSSGQAGGFRAAFIAFFLAFLVSMSASLYHGLRTIQPRLKAPPPIPGHRRLYWGYDVLQHSTAEYLGKLTGLRGEDLLEEMAYELFAATWIQHEKFQRINLCLRWAVASFVLWLVLLGSTVLS